MALEFELLGYQFSNTFNNATISRDKNGFLSNTYIGLRFANETGIATMFVSLNEKTDDYYIYSVQINERAGDYGTFGGVGYGVVKFYHVNGIICGIVVDDVEQGALRDMYNDCFNITPDMYVHIINQKNIRMSLCHRLSKSTGEMPEAC